MLNLTDIQQMIASTAGQSLTLYLNVDNTAEENQAAQPAWRIWLKNTLRELNEKHSTDAAWKPIHEQVESFLSYHPDSKSLALFTGANFQRAIELEVSLENQWYYGEPSITPLLWALDEYEPYFIALVDQEKARFFVTQLGQIEFKDTLEIDLEAYDFVQKTLMPATSAVVGGHPLTQGSNRDSFEDMIGEHRNRFYRDIVSQIQREADQYGAQRIIIGGVEESAHAVRNFMTHTLAQRVIAVVPIPMRSTTQQIAEIVLPHALEYERQGELALINEVIDFAKSGGRGALGPKAVMEALEMQRVELLIMPRAVDDADLMTELPLRTFASGGSVELVHGEAADRLKQEGGLAARLFYAL